MRTQRFEEIMASMGNVGEGPCHKSEKQKVLFGIQESVVKATYNGEHAATGDLKIWDVERYLKQLNEERGHVADEELARFKEGSKVLCNLIKAEISGNRGEYKAFKALECLHSENRILKNVELTDGETRTELDEVVITPKCVTIVEVKNTGKNIFIDAEGNYYSTGEFLKWDSNIAEKMSVKEGLLRTVLDNAGYKNLQIRSVVVFTNNCIEVQNKCNMIRTCFVSQLAHIIEGYCLDEVLSSEKMDSVQRAVESTACKEVYELDFDAKQYKTDFANLMVALEFANIEETGEQEVVAKEVSIANKVKKTVEKKVTIKDAIKSVFTSKEVRYASSAMSAIAITFVSSVVAANIIKKEV